ncbi:MAG: ParA family protein [Haliscomenobacteraceae bacterium CHB4]|nr:ParA family protein [Haliscomenobacteraceae bacterium CHB4]
MPTLSLAIQKGGSGKTTTAINLAAALQQLGKRVLLVDLDPQANCTQSLGILEEPEYGMYELLKEAGAGETADVAGAVRATASGLDLLPASLELANAELEMVSMYSREKLVKQLLRPLEGRYDMILIDCPPAVGMLTVNALMASDYVIMPLQAEFLPLRGVKSFWRTLEKIKKQLHPNLNLLGFVLTKFEPHKKMTRSVLEQLEVDYAGLVFNTRIRTNIALAQAQEAGTDIFHFDKNANGAKDYLALAEELLKKLQL